MHNNTMETAMATIEIPAPLRPYTNDQSVVDVNGHTVGAVLDDLISTFPSLEKHLKDKKGNLRSFVNIYLGDEDIRALDGLETEVESGDELVIIPSIAGGV
jgi:molybdopterin converting factor small subunit